MAEGFQKLSVDNLQTPNGVAALNRMLQLLFDLLPVDQEKVKFVKGYGTPENNIAAGVGSVYLREDGGASATLYIKESGTGDTGWVAK